MRKIILLLLPLLSCSACEELEEFDYVVVTVTGTVQVAFYDFENAAWGDAIPGEAVEMVLIKAGGERVEETGTTGGGEGMTSIHASFNLYKEQPIDFKAKLLSNTMIIGSDRVTWEYVNSNRRYGGKNQPDICTARLFIPLKVPTEKAKD